MNGTLWFSGVGWKSSTPGFLVRDVYPKNPMNNYGEMRFGISSTNVFGTIRISYVFPSECASVGCPEPTWLVGSISPILLNGFLPASGQAFLVGDVGPLSTGSSTVPIIPAPTTSLFDGNFVSIYAVVGPYKEDLFLSFARSSIPVFTTQPTNRVVSPSETTRFVVLATGAPTNMAYRWFKDGLPLLGVARITGTTSNVLTIANIQTADLGDYYVTASNLVGVTTSQVAQMWMPPTISVQPLSQVLAEGANTGLGVSVAGTQPMSYQWLLNGTNLPDSGNVGGTMGPTLTLLNLQPANAGSYSVVITNLVGSTTSSVATVSLSPSAPTISIQPQSQTVAVHGDVQLNCFAAGTMPISYQWRRNETNLVDGAKVIGGAAAILSLYDLGGADSGNYTLVASNAYGSATSMVAVVSVVLPPSIVQQPQSQGIKIGGTFSALVQATGGTPLTYQWRRNSTNLINGGRIAGVATTNLSITGLVPGDAGNYDVVVTNASGLTNSAVAVLSVLIPPSITAQPQNVATNVGAAATFSVGTSGSAPMNFQWQFNGTNLVNSAFASGVNSNVLTLSNIQANAVGFYSVVVSNSVGVTNSQIATLSLFLNQTFTFANSNQIVINDNAKATPYPTTLTVSGVSAAVQRARVTLVNVTHSYPADIQALLVGPLGQKVLLMSGAGVSMSPNQTFIFSDTATGMLPQSSQLLSGTYLPTAWPPTPTFPSPAPAAPFGSALSVFTNQNPNGVWTLYVMDNSAGDAGVIAGGWSVALDTSATQMQAPSITSTPRGLARTAGESAAFSVTAAGTQPFYYLWRRNGTNLTDGVRISGTGTPLLTLTNLQRSDAASFTVVVSNLVSAVTSTPPAVLTVAPIMFDSSARQLDGTFQLNLHGEIGTVFVIQNSADLKTWKQLVTFTNTTGVFQFTDPGAASTEKRFYRAIAQ